VTAERVGSAGKAEGSASSNAAQAIGSAGPGGGRGWLWLIGMPASFLAISFLATLPIWLSRAPRLVGYGSDTAMHLWFLRWFPFALTHGLNPFVTNLATYPHSVNLLWNNANLVLAFLSWPLLQLVGGARGSALIYVGLIAAAAAGTAGVLRPHVRHASSAWLGGLLVGFSPFALSEMAAGHLTWVTTATLPLGWWIGEGAVRAVRQRRHRVIWGIACGAWVIVQFWFSKELLATSLLMAVLLAVALYARGRWRELAWVRWAGPALVAAGVTVAALMLYPLLYQLQGSVSLTLPAATSTTRNVADLLSFLVPGYSQLLSVGATNSLSGHFTGTFLETDAYVGLPLLLLVAWVALRQRRNGLVVFGSWCAGLGALLALGPWLHVGGLRLDIPLPWLLFGHLPVYAKAVPSRLLVFWFIGVACLLAAGWDALWDRISPMGRALAVALLVAPLLPSLGILQGLGGFPVTLPAVLASPQLRALPARSVLLTVPVSTRDNHGLSMYWQAESNFRFAQPFGYLLHPAPGGATTVLKYPSALERLFRPLTVGSQVPPRSAGGELRAEMRAWHVAAVVVMPTPGFGRDVRVLVGILQRPPELIDGAAVWFHPGYPGSQPS